MSDSYLSEGNVFFAPPVIRNRLVVFGGEETS